MKQEKAAAKLDILTTKRKKSSGLSPDIRKRRDLEKDKLKKKIISTCLRVANNDGWSAVNIRRIAGEIKYSLPVIYAHFESKAILFENCVKTIIEKYEFTLDNYKEIVNEMFKNKRHEFAMLFSISDEDGNLTQMSILEKKFGQELFVLIDNYTREIVREQKGVVINIF